MILVDPRAGSKELLDPLAAAGLPVESQTLEFGDLMFEGRGVGGASVWVGVEHKKLPDLVQSLQTERLAGHQLRGLLDTYDRPYLLIEGEWGVDEAGRVVTPSKFRNVRSALKGAPPAVELLKRVYTLETRGGLRTFWSPNQRITVQYLTALYRFWTDKDLDAHTSHLAIHAPDLDSALGRPVSDFQRVVAQIGGIGIKRSAAVDAAFGGSFRRMMLASEQEWAAITTSDKHGKARRLGESAARKIMTALK